MRMIPVVVCMGSSCFSRGNNRNIEVVMAVAGDPGLPARVCPRGHLCHNLCNQGPNVTIGEQTFHGADPVTVAAALQEQIRKAAASGSEDKEGV